MRFWFHRSKAREEGEGVAVQTAVAEQEVSALELPAPIESSVEVSAEEKTPAVVGAKSATEAVSEPNASEKEIPIVQANSQVVAAAPDAQPNELPAQPPVEQPAILADIPVEEQCGIPVQPPAETAAPADGDPLTEVTPEAAMAELRAESVDWALEEKLAAHKEWIESSGKAGKKADLAGAKYEGAELVGVNLRYADLEGANLKEADLLLADLRDACLARANLEEACLVGANLEGANLEEAQLESAMGLVPQQLAGANVRDAILPSHVRGFPAREAFAAATRTVVWLFTTTIFVNFLSWLMIWKARDVQLVTDTAILPFLHSSAAAAALPTAEIFLLAPAVLLSLYLVLLFHLQRLWDAVLELPAVFPDGQLLGEKGPWIVTGLLRLHFRWMNKDAPSTRIIEKFISGALAYWIVPVTLVFFWGRYLTVQEMHGAALQSLFVVAAVAAAIYATTKVGRPQTVWTEIERASRRFFQIIVKPAPLAIGLGIFLLLLSFGTVKGAPHDSSRAPQISAADIRRWAPSFFWSLGYDPFPDLTEAALSVRPANWSGSDDQVASVRGARLNNLKFRYAQAYGVFLANAHLWRADFQGAFLSEADLRGADLGQSNLRYAVLDRALLNRANLDRAVLDSGNFTRADMRGANLSYSSVMNATLVDVRLDGASLYAARLGGTSLIRASLEKADLRDAHLEGANFENANLQQAYFWSAKLSGANFANSLLGNAILIEADLRGADFHGAQLAGTVLTGANLKDANLDGADMRGALRVSADQICSARSRVGTLLDDALQAQVNALCGPTSSQ
jgi:uncharacterized protein YjbI with pentapeptide repeats